jgi:uncharacterized protein (DUF4415 family)
MNSEDKMSKELTRQERLDAEIKKSLDARTKEFKEKIQKLTYEKIKQALVPSKEPLKGYPHNEEVTISMDESVNEALKAGKGKGLADIDYVGDRKLTQKIEKMFKIKIKQTGNTTADVTGEKKDILNFLQKHYYYDNLDVMELHPEIVEDKDLEEFGGPGMSAADKANLRRRIADKRKK